MPKHYGKTTGKTQQTKSNESKKPNRPSDEKMELVSDKHYDIVSVLFHAMQAAETLNQYIEDAEEQGDDELCDFFEEVQQEQNRLVTRAQQLLASRISRGSMMEESRDDMRDRSSRRSQPSAR